MTLSQCLMCVCVTFEALSTQLFLMHNHPPKKNASSTTWGIHDYDYTNQSNQLYIYDVRIYWQSIVHHHGPSWIPAPWSQRFSDSLSWDRWGWGHWLYKHEDRTGLRKMLRSWSFAIVLGFRFGWGCFGERVPAPYHGIHPLEMNRGRAEFHLLRSWNPWRDSKKHQITGEPFTFDLE